VRDPSPFVSELNDAVRIVGTLWPSLRGIERTAAIAHVRVSQLSRASNLEYPEATTSVSHMQRLLNKAGLNMPVVHQRSEPAPDSQTARTDSFEDRVRMLYVDSHTLCRAAAAFCRSVESLRADARLWSATEVIAAADYHAPIAAEVASSPNAAIAIDDLNLSVRTAGRLKKAGVQTAGEIGTYTAGELRMLCDLGQKSIHELNEELPKLGITLLQE
jgi:hypothetical protein